MRIARVFASYLMFLPLLGCSALDGNYVRDGIGTTLGTADLVEASRLQDIYIGEVCRQAGLRTVLQGDFLACEDVGMRPAEWSTFVQAGMNDIDRRCDAYLGWLDNKRRWREPVLKQLHTTAAATGAILGLTGVGAVPIAIVGTAFGLAQDSFVNFNARLITEIDHSVVQEVVLGNQNRFRANLAKVRIDNRPAAIYLLRNYLRICMPFSIEMSINSTITTFHRAGPDGLRFEPILTRGPRIAQETAFRPSDRPGPHVYKQRPTLADYSQIIVDYNPEMHFISRVEPALLKICVPAAELRTIGERTKLAIRIYQLAAGLDVTGKLRTSDLTRLNNAPDCLPGRLNFYEAKMTNGPISPNTATLFNFALAANRKLSTENPTEVEIRSRIRELRQTLAPQLILQGPLLNDQITSDLMATLTRIQLSN